MLNVKRGGIYSNHSGLDGSSQRQLNHENTQQKIRRTQILRWCNVNTEAQASHATNRSSDDDPEVQPPTSRVSYWAEERALPGDTSRQHQPRPRLHALVLTKIAPCTPTEHNSYTFKIL